MPVDFKAIVPASLKGSILPVKGGGDCFIAGVHFALSGNHAAFLSGVLPPIAHLPAESDKAALR